MIDLNSIKSFYPEKERGFEQFLLKEYLQYTILDIVFSSKYSQDLVFIWGTAIRLMCHSNRFSEDLDFDNFWLSPDDFDNLSIIIWQELKKQWYEAEIRNVFKWAYHCHIKLPKILKELWFSNFEDEKILIQIDTVTQDYQYRPDLKILDRFDVYRMIRVCPMPILLSKKIHSLLDRKRTKGRDMYDIVHLYKFVQPDFDYLSDKRGIRDITQMKQVLLEFCDGISLKDLANDVWPFLINPNEIRRISEFREFVAGM